MSMSGAPGVTVVEQLTPIPPTQSAFSASLCGFIGENWYGPVNKAILLNRWQDFVKYFGGFNLTTVPVLANPYLAYAVNAYFANGGLSCYVARIASSATPGSSSSVTMSDSTATPQTTLRLTAGQLGVSGNPGTWGNTLIAVVTAMPTVNRFTVTIYKGSTATPPLETWYDLSMTSTDARYAPTIINSASAGSLWVFAADLADRDVFANAPAAGTYPLTGGIDPADPAVGDWETSVTSGTAPFDYVQGPLSFALPGQTTAAIVNTAIAYSQARQDSFYVIDPPSGQTPSAAVSYYNTLSPLVSTAGLYFPWLNTSNPASANVQATILLPPSGAVLGQFVETDTTQGGPWVAPAGTKAQLTNVVAAERVLSQSDIALLNNSNVDAIKTLPSGAIVIWGARTLQSGYSTLYVPVRRTLNYVEASLVQVLNGYVFAPNDSATWSSIIASCTAFLGRLLSAGAFPGTTQSSSFYVICDTTNNTPQTIAQGVLNVTVGLAVQYPAEFVVLTIQQFQGVTTSSAA
jgi:uncharacterized protein